MRAVVFCGPTLDAGEARGALDAEILPPAQQGDVLLAARRGAGIIALVDGRFDQVDAVAHKEILWAMAEGVHVLGAASMGALRAAELHAFGMEGVGAIYEGYASGAIEDDDEVAVTHGTEETGFRALSEAMVDLRATAAAATAAGAIGEDDAEVLLAAAKGLFYPDRVIPTVLAEAARRGLRSEAGAAFRDVWARGGRVSQKRADALALLQVVRARLGGEIEPKRVRYTFAHTDAWAAVCRRALAREAGGG